LPRSHHSSSSDNTQSSLTLAGAAWWEVESTGAWERTDWPGPLRITRKGTETVGAGSPGGRMGPDDPMDAGSLMDGPWWPRPELPWTGGRQAPERPGKGSSRDDPARSTDLLPRDPRGWESCRRARALAVPLMVAPPRAAIATQTPRGSGAERKVRNLSDTNGLGLMAATHRVTSRGLNRGSSSSSLGGKGSEDRGAAPWKRTPRQRLRNLHRSARAPSLPSPSSVAGGLTPPASPSASPLAPEAPSSGCSTARSIWWRNTSTFWISTSTLSPTM
jgi:hypothetical protein